MSILLGLSASSLISCPLRALWRRGSPLGLWVLFRLLWLLVYWRRVLLVSGLLWPLRRLLGLSGLLGLLILRGLLGLSGLLGLFVLLGLLGLLVCLLRLLGHLLALLRHLLELLALRWSLGLLLRTDLRAQVTEIRGDGESDGREWNVLRVGLLDLLWVLLGQLLHVRCLLVCEESPGVGVPVIRVVSPPIRR